MTMNRDDWLKAAIPYLMPLIIDVVRAGLHEIGIDLDRGQSSKLEDAFKLEFGKAKNVTRAEKIYAGIAHRIPPVA